MDGWDRIKLLGLECLTRKQEATKFGIIFLIASVRH